MKEGTYLNLYAEDFVNSQDWLNTLEVLGVSSEASEVKIFVKKVESDVD